MAIVDIERARSIGSALPLGPETTGQAPQVEFMTPDEFIQSVRDHVIRIQMDSGVLGGGTLLRLGDEVKDDFDWKNPDSWQSPKRVVERYVIYMDPRRSKDDFSVEFLFQIHQMNRDIASHEHHRPATTEIEEQERSRRAREGALAFYKANTQIVGERLAAAYPQLTGVPED